MNGVWNMFEAMGCGLYKRSSRLAPIRYGFPQSEEEVDLDEESVGEVFVNVVTSMTSKNQRPAGCFSRLRQGGGVAPQRRPRLETVAEQRATRENAFESADKREVCNEPGEHATRYGPQVSSIDRNEVGIGPI